MEEKVYHQDENVKITNLRITCNHVTVPIDKIEHVVVGLKVNTLSMAFIAFLLSFFSFYGGVKALVPGILLIIVTFIWLSNVYQSYVEFKVLVGSKYVKLLDTSMGNREYVFKIEDALNDAIFDDQMERKLVAEKGGQPFSPTETLKLRQMLLDYKG